MPLPLPLAQRVVDAYGGADRWQSATRVEAEVSASGFAFRMKWRRPVRHAAVAASVTEPYVRADLETRGGPVAVLHGTSARIESADGRVLDAREDPRSKFPGGRRLLWWDRLDLAYFSGYALWNYLCFPALLMRGDIEWSAPGEHTLVARFPPHLPTHSPEQAFHVDPDTARLRQHDYTALVFGDWAKAANVVLAHAEEDGLPYPSHRRVTPRAADGRPKARPLFVDIRVHRFALV